MISDSLTASVIFAQAAGSSAGADAPGGMGMLGFPMIMVLMMVILFVVTGSSQRKKQRETDKMQKELQPGDEVVTIGGAHGVITSIKEKTLTLRMAEGKIEFDRTAVASRVGKKQEDAAPAK